MRKDLSREQGNRLFLEKYKKEIKNIKINFKTENKIHKKIILYKI